MNTKKLAISIGRVVRRESTKIFAGMAIAAEAIGFYCMHKEAPIVHERIKALPENATTIDKVKTAGPVYLPAIGMFLISSGCVIGGCIAGERKAALMAGLYSASEAALRRYEEKLIEKVGPEKAEEIHREAVKETLNERCQQSSIIPTGFGDTLCYEPLSGRYFTSDKIRIEEAANRFNRLIIGDMWASVNEWFMELGLPEVGLGDSVGWNVDHMMDIAFTCADSPFNKPCFVIEYRTTPVLYR